MKVALQTEPPGPRLILQCGALPLSDHTPVWSPLAHGSPPSPSLDSGNLPFASLAGIHLLKCRPLQCVSI